MVGDPFNLESKGSVNANFLRRGVSGSIGGTRTRKERKGAKMIMGHHGSHCEYWTKDTMRTAVEVMHENRGGSVDPVLLD